jgi:hypothetical protein
MRCRLVAVPFALFFAPLAASCSDSEQAQPAATQGSQDAGSGTDSAVPDAPGSGGSVVGSDGSQGDAADGAGPAGACHLAQPPPYPPKSTYVGTHGNRENNGRIGCAGPAKAERAWAAAPQHLIFQPISVSHDATTIYATAAKTSGCQLLAIDMQTGAQVWCKDGFTLGVSASTPEVDADGNLYVTDGWTTDSYMMSLTSKGEVRWKTSLEGLGGTTPPATYRACTGLKLTPSGHAAVETVDGVVALLARDTGALVASFDIPKATGFVPPKSEAPPSVKIPDYLKKRLETIVGPMTDEQLTYVVFGGVGAAGAFSNNTVGVSVLEQLFVIGGGPDPDTGALVALDLTAGPSGPSLGLRWVMHVQGGSGTSPSITPDGTRLVVGDAAARLLYVDVAGCNANTDGDPKPDRCAPLWTYKLLGDNPILASPSIDENGVVYAWSTSKEPADADLVAVGDDGGKPKVLWTRAFTNAAGTNMQWTSATTVLDNIVVGTLSDMKKVLGAFGTYPVALEVSHEVVAVWRKDGTDAWRRPLDDDSINSIAPGPDGSIYVPLMGVIDLASPNPNIAYQGGIIKYAPVP